MADNLLRIAISHKLGHREMSNERFSKSFPMVVSDEELVTIERLAEAVSRHSPYDLLVQVVEKVSA